MGVIRKTEAVGLVLKEFKKEANAIAAVELIKRLDQKINKTSTTNISILLSIFLMNKRD